MLAEEMSGKITWEITAINALNLSYLSSLNTKLQGVRTTIAHGCLFQGARGWQIWGGFPSIFHISCLQRGPSEKPYGLINNNIICMHAAYSYRTVFTPKKLQKPELHNFVDKTEQTIAMINIRIDLAIWESYAADNFIAVNATCKSYKQFDHWHFNHLHQNYFLWTFSGMKSTSTMLHHLNLRILMLKLTCPQLNERSHGCIHWMFVSKSYWVLKSSKI